MKQKLLLFFIAFAMAAVNVLVCYLTNNGPVQCIPLCVFYLMMIYKFDDWVLQNKSIVSRLLFTFEIYFYWNLLLILGLQMIGHITISWHHLLLAVPISLVLAITQLPFIYKSYKIQKRLASGF